MSEHYNEWATALAKHFFGPHMSGKRTRLTVNREFLNEEFGYLGGFEGFISAIKSGPKWSYFGIDPGLHEKAINTYNIWKQPQEQRPRGCQILPNDAPSYLPFLVLLCLAWTIDDEEAHLSGNSFYDRLGLICPDHELDSVHLSQWRKLWEGLETWSDQLEGKYGIWKLEVVGLANVGIPCSQTILTPCKLRRLPWLFHVTSLAVAAKNRIPNANQIKAQLLQKESYTGSVLGNYLTKQVIDNTNIGAGVLNLLQEQLENPENRIYEEHTECSPHRGESDNEAVAVIPLRVALERSSKDNKWHIRYCLLEENPPVGNAEDQNWSFIKKGISTHGPFWIALSQNLPVSVSAHHMQPDYTFQIEFEAEDEDGAKSLQLRTRKRGIRIFRNWVCQNFLFEEYDLPDSGGCYLLVHLEQKSHLATWLSEFEASGGKSTLFPQDGLPAYFQLIYLESLERSSQNLLSRFPEITASTTKPSYLSFSGGSRIQGAGAERLYLAYDLPTVVMESRGEVSLTATGAKLIQIADNTGNNNNLPGNHLQEFEIEIEKDTASATFEVIDSQTSNILETRTIGITQHLLDNFDRDISEKIQFDHFGQGTDRTGIFGYMLDSSEAPTQTQKSELGRYIEYEIATSVDDEETDDKRWDLLESLCLKTRITAREFRRKVESITGDWQAYYTWSDLRWLRALGHVEIERDKKGRIAYIYPVDPCAFKLPWMKGDLTYFGIAGCPTHTELELLKKNTKELDCKIYAHERGSSILPPLIVIEGEEDSARLCLDDAGFECPEATNGAPDAERVAYWAGSIEERCRNFYWQPGYVQEPESVFNPYCFRMLAPKRFSCPYKLYSIPDSYSNHNKWHAMMKTPGANDVDDEVRHVFLTDPSWGKWLTLGRASRGIPPNIDCPNLELTPIPYDPQQCELIVPASLRFPSILTKALLMCSGMPPRIVRPSRHFTEEGSLFLPESDMPYTGTCYAFRLIPRQIAQVICSKVSAWPVDVTPINKPHLQNV